MNSKSAEAHEWLGKIELRLKRVERAVSELKKALELDPVNQPARRLLTQAYAIQKRPDQATAYLRQIEPGEVPESVGDEAVDFLLSTWQLPTGAQ